METNEMNSFVGKAFEDLSEESMELIQGSGDITVEGGWSPVLSRISNYLTVSYEVATITVCRD